MEIRTPTGTKQPLHFGVPERPLFGFYHPPADGPWRGVGVVLCPPIGTDRTRCDRAYRHLAEGLSGAGFACLRFDLTGTGDSSGDETDRGLLAAWRDDLGRAIDEVRARSGADRVAVVGLRWGATLAMDVAAARGDVDALVLWSPFVSGTQLASEVTKLHTLYLRIEPQLANTRPIEDGKEALGMLLSPGLLAELGTVDIAAVARRPARRTLVIDGGNFPQRNALMAQLETLGAAPELRSHPGQKFLITVSHRAPLPEEVLESIGRWLAEVYPARDRAPRPAAARPAVGGPEGERPVVFGGSRPLFGLLTPGRGEQRHPPVLVLNAGCVNRSGLHRMTVRMARRWAALGFSVLRVDLSGIGDSPVAPGAPENVTYPPGGLEDIAEGIGALGSDRVIVAGHCSGGDYAFQIAARDPRVAGVCILNPRTFCVLDLTAVEGGEGAPVTDSVEDVPRTLRRIADRGVDTVLVVSRADPGVAYVDAHAADAMAALREVPGFRRIDVEGSDHAFTPVQVQREVNDLLTAHLSGAR